MNQVRKYIANVPGVALNASLRSYTRPRYDHFRVRTLFVLFVTACTGAPLARMPAMAVPREPHHDQTRYFSIWLGGARVGTATEAERWSSHGVRLERTEVMRFMRGEREVEMITLIAIDADPALVPHRVLWTETTGRVSRSAEIHVREGDAGGAWQGTLDAPLAPHAVPAELVPLLVRRDGHFAGTVFLPARNFASGRGHIDPVAPGRLVAQLALDSGPLAEATIDQASDGMPARVVDGEGVIAIRITQQAAFEAFPAVDLVAATAVPIGGVHPRHGHHLTLTGDLALPAVPGQVAIADHASIGIELGAQLPGALPAEARGPDRAAEIRQLVSGVRARITPDLGATHISARDAEAATAGDCTTFALAYAALATRRGIRTHVITGLRVDGDRLVRHRWAVSWTGRAWIAVDAAFGEVPAGGDLIGLAIHDADDAGLVSGEAALTHVHAATW
ncbi:hypothetical protein BH11MYX1_BH11MYX1_09610 [soil metagenome]